MGTRETTAADPTVAASVAVLILTFNQRETTLACLASLLTGRDVPFRVLVWDNGSEDGTAEAVAGAYPGVLVHRHSTNLGVAGGRNAAAEIAIRDLRPTHLLFLDNDMEVDAGFVGALLSPFLRDPSVGQTQAKLRLQRDRTRLNDGGGARISFVLWRVSPVGYGEIDRGQYDRQRACIACGGAMMVRSEVFGRLGGFDPQFGPFGPEDLDFSLRLQKAGYRALFVPGAVAYHATNHTFGRGYTEAYARNKVGHWFSFMRRHASPLEKLAFFLVGAPYLTLSVARREWRRGNVQGLRGLVRGSIDSMACGSRAKSRKRARR
jgi:GT2 family glycosyltransferase